MNNWYDDAVFYHIYPLGAVNTKRDNDYRGDADGLVRLGDWVEHMVKLGCNAVYLGPTFESRTHGYDTTDYRKTDSRLGTDQQFIDFVEKCHQNGIRVVVDGVFNHTGRDFFAFEDIRKHREGSQYRDWYQGMNFGGNNPLDDGFTYEAWRGHWELPRLNPHNPQVRQYLFDTVRDWIDRFHVDGIRLDCADCLDFGFMKDLRSICTSAKEDFWLMGEVIHGDYTRWANGDTLHSVTNYECAKGLYSSHNDGNMHEIAYSFGRQFGPGGIYKDLMLYNFADNHDVNRLADTVHKKEYLPTIYTLLYTMPGLPSIYYGSEWGIGGVSDRVTDWNLRPQIDIDKVQYDDPDLMAHIANLAVVRSRSAALRHGQYSQLSVTARQFAYQRSLPDETVVVLINCDERPAEFSVPMAGTVCADLMHPSDSFTVRDGKVAVTVAAYSSRVLGAAVSGTEVRGDAWEPVRQPASTPAPVAAPQAVPSAPPQPGALTVDTLLAKAADIAPEHENEHAPYEYVKRAASQGKASKTAFYELPPGKAAYPYHYHLDREETFYILKGNGTLRTPAGERTVAPGDLLFFPAGKDGAHKLTNASSDESLVYLDFDTCQLPDVVYYPDSGKVGINDGTVTEDYRRSQQVDYYDGE